jgi:Tol biopolymer transport system component
MEDRRVWSVMVPWLLAISVLATWHPAPHPGRARLVEWSAPTLPAGGELLAFGTPDGIEVVDLATGERTQLTDGRLAGQADQLAWSPDGARLAFTVSRLGSIHLYRAANAMPEYTVGLIDLTSGRGRTLAGWTLCAQVGFTLDGGAMVYTLFDGSRYLDLSTGEQGYVRGPVVFAGPPPGLAGEGRVFHSMSGSADAPHLVEMDLHGEVVKDVAAPDKGVGFGPLSPNGAQLSGLRYDGAAAELVVSDLPDGEWHTLKRGDHLDDPAWSPDGRRIALSEWAHPASPRADACSVWVVDVASGDATRVREASDMPSNVAWSPSGERLGWLEPGAILVADTETWETHEAPGTAHATAGPAWRPVAAGAGRGAAGDAP